MEKKGKWVRKGFAHSRSSQAALEFLTTYGWAFLVILIMIGALAYFGILTPGKLLPGRCNFPPEFSCIDYQISAASNTFKLRLKNGLGEAIDVSVVNLSSEGVTSYSCTTPPTLPTAWKSGETKDLTWSSCNSAAAGMVASEKGKIKVTMRYNTVAAGSSYAREAAGEVYANVV